MESILSEVNEWRTKRIGNLTADGGWLTLCGLFWLNEGENKVGSAEDCIVQLPKCPQYAGSIIVNSASSIVFQPNDTKAVYSEVYFHLFYC